MPELPEVETVARELKKTIIGKTINYIEPIWIKSFENNSDLNVSEQKVISIDRRGKYLIICLEKSYLVVHLRMTGQLLYFDNEKETNLDDYIRVIIKFHYGMLLFKDVRKFGRIYHVENIKSFLSHIGPDALDENFTEKCFANKLQSSKMSIKAFLLSQKFVSGMGNIYTDEVLFLSKVHPSTIAANIPKKRRKNLFINMQSVLKNSVQNMGSTISDYRDPAGKKGKNQYYFNVYGRDGMACKVCESNIVKMKFAGRGTHYCPKCQIVNY